MKTVVLGLILLAITSIACTGGRSRSNRDGYCFNDENSQKYDPLPVTFESSNYRKAVFNTKVSSADKKNIVENKNDPATEVVQEFNAPIVGGGDLNDKIEQTKEQEKRRLEARKRELAKIYPLEVGTYKYVEAEIYTTKELPQLVSRNKYQRIYVSHLKNKDDKF